MSTPPTGPRFGRAGLPESNADDATVVVRRLGGAAPPPPPPPLSKPPGGGRRIALLAGVAIVLLALAGGGYWLTRPAAPPVPAPVPADTAAARPQAVAAPPNTAPPNTAPPNTAPPAAQAPVAAAAPPAASAPAVQTPVAAPAAAPAPPPAPPAPAPAAAAPRPTSPAAEAAAAAAAAMGSTADQQLALLTPATPAPPPPPPHFDIVTGDEAAIAAHSAPALAVFRFAAAPAIVVLDFPSLTEQGMTLNRVAAMTEKAGQPHDRVLTDAELDAAIKAHGDTVGSYYYGHDYSAAELARFFALADSAHLRLNAPEERLRALLTQLGWLPTPPAAGALLSFSRAGADADITPATRSLILHHELSHGAFFTEPRFAAYVRKFWKTELRDKERAAMRRYLADDGYEPADEDLTVNEMQAYLMFTHGREFFDIASVGLTQARRGQLEAAFRRGLPEGWLRQFPADPPPLPQAISSGCAPSAKCP